MKSLIVNGVTLYCITDEILNKFLSNPNLVIVFAYKTNPYIPVYYQRFCDYIDSKKIEELGLVEVDSKSLHIEESKFPLSFRTLVNIHRLACMQESHND